MIDASDRVNGVYYLNFGRLGSEIISNFTARARGQGLDELVNIALDAYRQRRCLSKTNRAFS
jgi:hypothetical protein